jgi:hypothetical protein
VEKNKEFELPLSVDEKKIGDGLFGRYVALIKEIWVSHSDYLCYLFMLITVIKTGGFLYLVYPLMIFGKAVIHENRPGKTYWFIILVFTQCMIVGNFIVQLKIWGLLVRGGSIQEDAPCPRCIEWQTLLIEANLGFFKIPEPDF